MTVTVDAPTVVGSFPVVVRPWQVWADLSHDLSLVASKDPVRPVLCAAKVELEDEALVFVATDSYRMVRVTLELEADELEQVKAAGELGMIDVVRFAQMVKACKPSSSGPVPFDLAGMLLGWDRLAVGSDIPAEEYPNWRQLWPNLEPSTRQDGEVPAFNPAFVADLGKFRFGTGTRDMSGVTVRIVANPEGSLLKPAVAFYGAQGKTLQVSALLMPVRVS